MRNALPLQPCPVRRGPPLRITIAAGLDEFEKPLIGDVVAFDRKRLDTDPMGRKLVVPAERRRRTIDSERGHAVVDVDPFRARRHAVCSWRITVGASLLLMWESMPHVQERFLMHRLVLEDGERR